MVLRASDGESISSIARSLGTSRFGVRRWLIRFNELRVEGITDLPRSGRPVEITPLVRHQLIALACDSPRDHGLVRDIWSHETLAQVLVEERRIESISPRSVGLILEAAEIKPHRVKMWCHSNDPQFEAKMRAIVDLYVNPPEGEPVLCIDEKTGMQALSRKRELKRPAEGPGRFDFEYCRHGTHCLFGCFNIRTGKVLGRCTPTRKRHDFFAFMDLVAATYRQPRVHVVLDNLNTHIDTKKGAFVTEWNHRHGNRFVFHYTPTKGSWLNQIELWFGILSRRVLRYGNFRSKEELVRSVDTFIQAWNREEAHPFRWTFTGFPLVS